LGRAVASGLEFEFFPVDFPLAGNFLETIPAQTATTAIYFYNQLFYRNKLILIPTDPQISPQIDS
jgi:hypothetical protein